MWKTHSKSSRLPRSLLIGCTLTLLLAGRCLGEGLPERSFPIKLDQTLVLLEGEPAPPSAKQPLRFLAGFELRADRPEYGGFSGLECDGEDRLIAVSDRGHWLSMRLEFDEMGHLRSLLDGQMGPLLDDDGQPVTGRGRRDAEELVSLSENEFLVTFEGEHRAALYRSAGGHSLDSLPQPLATPRDIYRGDDNAGFEAVTRLADGRLLLLTEGLRDAEGRLLGWLSAADVRGEDAVPTYLPILLESIGPFQPTAATTVPKGAPMAGDVLLLQRHYSPETGTRVRLYRVPSAELRPGTLVRPQELMRFEAPRTVDNFEGLAVCPRPHGGVAVYMISDDNFSPKQRTLLYQLQLTLPDG